MVCPRAGVTQLVECDLAKVDVAGSNPVSRSIFHPQLTVHDSRLLVPRLLASMFTGETQRNRVKGKTAES